MKHPGRWRPVARAAFGAILLGLLIHHTDFQEFWRALRLGDHRFAAAGFLVFGLLALFEVLRLHVVLSGYPVSLGGAAHLYYTGMFFSNFIPSSLGAEVYKVHLLRKLENNLAKPIALLLVLRVTGLALMLLSAAVYLPFAFPRVERHLNQLMAQANVRLEPLLWGGVACGLLGLGFLLLPQGQRLLRRKLPALRSAAVAVANLGTGSHLLLLSLGCAVIACRTGSIYYFTRGLGEATGFLDVLLVVALVNIASLLPISFGALGVREGTMAVALMAFDVAPPHALAVALLSRCALWAVSLVGGILLLGRRKLSNGSERNG